MDKVQTQTIDTSKIVYPILFMISFSHLLNDLIQSTIPSLYPILKGEFSLSFSQIGIITLVFQLTASILQPFVGIYTDKKPNPRSLAIGMGLSMAGLLLLAAAHQYYVILIAVALIGMGSSIFHPEASRVAQLASGGQKGLAQSIFQVGGNSGSAIGPLLVALIILPLGQGYVALFAIAAFIGIIVLWRIGNWYAERLSFKKSAIHPDNIIEVQLSRKKVIFSISVLLALVFSKYIYLASMTNYFTFFLIDKFHISVKDSQLYLFMFLAAVAIGTILGGKLGDKYGRKKIIWVSILGAAPFTLCLPYLPLAWTIIFAVLIGLIIASAFSAILVYATDLMPNKIGLVAGLFFGFMFGMGGIGSAVLGAVADDTGIEYVFKICAFLPLIGIITAFLPNIKGRKK
ncbi:MFS transporter [Chryseobacterium carnipullorum]|uniref:Fosmidomycin resistance protein n=1 Tax=Chryseobacterium carnipullorum TaxID=1124835 RepID=A0A1M7C4R8_CHRCU|nr:MFS transporter [Chryseobacterium carnipullorum]MDN5396471.1 MFS transporter [Chryseobacterium sp.]AZA47421.1 MFS transporter [Chryseobacterium carnipullorum]AZA66759.1 MFS transporter [Chryseobacterium carnipullorum]MDN5478544.1 MFS transporter [Chryseobacterium sp.]SHL62225.1 MFS transporter, FSR family, fosmidomycin resistance protein [Chryseobacterium carnipullorum]